MINKQRWPWSYRPNWYRIIGVALISMALHLLCGCTVARVGNLQVHVLCKQDLIEREGMSLRFEAQGVHHNHCDKRMPLTFTYAVGVH